MTFAGGVLAPLGRKMAALLMGAAISFAGFAQQEITEPIPVPKLVARVMDSTGTLNPAEMQRIEAKLQAFEQARGSQVAVLLVPSIGPETIEDFALRVTDAWKLGRAGVDDGVLFVIAKQQRKMRIQTGRGVQGTLTDAAAKRIIAERVAPAFRTGDFAGGIDAGVDAIMKAIEGEALPPPGKASAPKGKQLSESFGCEACHTLTGAKSTGPTWKGLAGRTVRLDNGKVLKATDGYLINAIEQPDAEIVAGYSSGIMTTAIGNIPVSEAKAIVAYIKSVK